MDASAVKRYLNDLQDRITAAVEASIGVKFRRDPWVRPEGGGGESRILSDGAVFERAGVSVLACVRRENAAVRLESAPGNRRRALRGDGTVAGVPSAQSSCAHDALQCPVPGRAPRAAAPAVWWFGGGFDLTPYYPYDEDVLHWHRMRARRLPAIRLGPLRKIQSLVRPLFFSAASKRDPRCRRLVLR